MTSDTSARDTPARAATSSSVGRLLGRATAACRTASVSCAGLNVLRISSKDILGAGQTPVLTFITRARHTRLYRALQKSALEVEGFRGGRSLVTLVWTVETRLA